MTMTGCLDRFNALEREAGLHDQIHVIYVVDGYTAELLGCDGDEVIRSATRPTLIEALLALAASE